MKGLKLSQWVGVVLGAACGLLMLWMVAQRFGLGQGYDALEARVDPVDAALLAPLKQSRHGLPPDAHFAEVQQRPLFNNDRKPTVIKATTTAPPPPPVTALNANLIGTVVAQGRHMALVRDNTTSKVVVLKPGMTMPGELAGWKLVSVDPRSAVFDGGPTSGGQVELKLDVSKSSGPALAPPPVADTATGASPVPPPPAQPPQAAMAQAAPTPADQAAKEAEVRRIIEERRAQMRAEAAKMGGN